MLVAGATSSRAGPPPTAPGAPPTTPEGATTAMVVANVAISRPPPPGRVGGRDNGRGRPSSSWDSSRSPYTAMESSAPEEADYRPIRPDWDRRSALPGDPEVRRRVAGEDRGER